MPIWSATLVLTIALGIGSTAAVQGFVRGLLTTDLPIMGIDTVVTVFAIDQQGRSGPVSFETFAALRSRGDLFQSLGAVRELQARVTIGGRATLLSVAAYTPEVATVLPLPARFGAAVSHRLRFAEYDAKANPVGSRLQVGDQDISVAAAMPFWLEGLYRGRAVDLWIPLDEIGGDRGRLWLLGRLAPGVTAVAAQDALASIGAAGGGRLTLMPYTGQTPESAAGMLRIGGVMQLASVLVFVIACANVAAFLLARAAARARETAVRVAIGARRRQLARQLLIDSALIAMLGGAGGFILASWLADLIPLMLFDADAERLVFAPHAGGIVFTSLLCIAITIVCGLAPLGDSRDDRPATVLQREIAGPSRRLGRVSAALIFLQMAGCTLLVIATGLLLQGFSSALDTPAGRRLGNPVLVSVEALQSQSKSQMAAGGLRYFDAVVEAARSVTTIGETVWASRLPGGRPSWQWARFDPARPARREVPAELRPLSPRELEQVALPPISGRLFGAFDAGPCRAAVINDTTANMIFKGFPIGRQLEAPNGARLNVIGVVRSAAAAATIYEHPAAAVSIGLIGETTFMVPAGDIESGLIDVNVVSPNYFDAVGLALVSGKLFDGTPDGCRIGVLNEEAAERWFGGAATGAAVIDATGRRTEIVGVVRSTLLRTEQRLAEPTLFLPMTQDFQPRMMAMMATADSDPATIDKIRERLTAVPGGRGDRLIVTTLDDHLSNTALAFERIAAVLVGAFAMIALLLGAVGLYGGLAESARRRQREFALRLALGAQAWRVVGRLLAEGGRIAAAGAVAGAIASLAAARWIAVITPGASWPSAMVWLALPFVLVGLVAMAGIIPARRAVSVDLVSLMRDI